MLIVLESTTYARTTNGGFLMRLGTNNYRVGEDMCLASSPERVDPGNRTWQTRNTLRVVGGVSPRWTKVAPALYRHAAETVVPLSSAPAAEMVKLLENAFGIVNTGLVHEASFMCRRLGGAYKNRIDADMKRIFLMSATGIADRCHQGSV